MRRVAVINQKGGVGKTTTTVNHGAALAKYEKKVLLLDLDPQANLTLHLDRQPKDDEKTLTDLLVEGVPMRELIHATSTPGMFVVPADTTLAGVEQILANRIGRETILADALADVAELNFDFILIDCPPSLGVLSANALVAATEVLVPLQTEYFALQGMAKLMEVIELVRRRLNPQLTISALLPCMFDSRTRLSSEVLAELSEHFGPLLAKSRIRSNVKLAEAPSFGRTIFEHAPESNGALDHENFAREYLGMEPLEEEEDEWEEEEEEEEEEDEVEDTSLEDDEEEEEQVEEEEEPEDEQEVETFSIPISDEDDATAEQAACTTIAEYREPPRFGTNGHGVPPPEPPPLAAEE